MLKKAEKVLRVLVSVAGIAGVCLFVFPQVLGWTPRIVVSGSMEPAVPTGSIAYTSRQIPQDRIKKGDIIAYRLSDEIPVLHRVTETNREAETWITKGDANESRDIGVVSYGQYLGKMIFYIPYAGYGWLVLQKKTMRIFAAGVGILLLELQLMEQKKTGKERTA